MGSFRFHTFLLQALCYVQDITVQGIIANIRMGSIHSYPLAFTWQLENNMLLVRTLLVQTLLVQTREREMIRPPRHAACAKSNLHQLESDTSSTYSGSSPRIVRETMRKFMRSFNLKTTKAGQVSMEIKVWRMSWEWYDLKWRYWHVTSCSSTGLFRCFSWKNPGNEKHGDEAGHCWFAQRFHHALHNTVEFQHLQVLSGWNHRHWSRLMESGLRFPAPPFACDTRIPTNMRADSWFMWISIHMFVPTRHVRGYVVGDKVLALS